MRLRRSEVNAVNPQLVDFCGGWVCRTIHAYKVMCSVTALAILHLCCLARRLCQVFIFALACPGSRSDMLAYVQLLECAGLHFYWLAHHTAISSLLHGVM